MLVVEFKSDQYYGSESSGFVEVTVTLSGGTSTTPISVLVTTTGQSATGDRYKMMYYLVLLYSSRIRHRFWLCFI